MVNIIGVDIYRLSLFEGFGLGFKNFRLSQNNSNPCFFLLHAFNFDALCKSLYIAARAMITGGKSLISSPPSFSCDGKKVLVCRGNTVSVFSTSTGMQITELEGHTGCVTSVIVVPAPLSASKVLSYCWTSSLDGTICYWDFSIPELIKKVDVRLPVFSMVIPNLLGPTIESNGKPSDLFAFVSVEDISKQNGQGKALTGKIWKFNLTKSSLTGGVLAETRYPEFITISGSGAFFGILNKRMVHIWKTNAKDSKYDVKKIKLHHTKNLSALAFHPTERIVAAGDVTGRILIWRGFGDSSFSESWVPTNRKLVKNEEENPGVRDNDDADSCSTWHWHPSKVKVLSFSSDGAYLYSGGKEGVLVIWQLETGKKKFLPRIGAPLLYFTDSPDPSLSSISCADNQIHLLQMPSMKVSKSIAGIKLASNPETYEELWSGMVFDHIAGLVAIPTETYSIQFYSLFDNREISQVQICERNHQPDDNAMLAVTSLALSLDGTKMSTVEVKSPEEGIGGLVCLKFWESGAHRGNFKLSTIVYEPHSDAKISGLAFHPTCDMAVSTSFGGDFKIWVQSYGVQQKNQMSQKTGWRCNSVGSYKEKPMTSAAFSSDGSVLAVSAEAVVTLWDPIKNILIAVIGEMLMPATTLSFVGKSEYLVSVSRSSKPQLSVWNTSKLSMSWSYNLIVEDVVCKIDGSCFAVLALIPKSPKRGKHANTAVQSRDGFIILFNVENPVPLASWSVKKVKGGRLSFLQADPASLAGKASDGTQLPLLLAYVSGDHEYVIFDPYCEENNTLSGFRRDTVVAPEETGKSGYSSIYGELPQFSIEKDQTTKIPYVSSERPWETIFSGSSHVLPPLTNLCSAFLESMLERRPIVQV